MATGFVSPEQIRAARGLLGWTQADLAKAAGVSRAAVADYESGRTSPYIKTLTAIVDAIEKAGLSFAAGGVIHDWSEKQ